MDVDDNFFHFFLVLGLLRNTWVRISVYIFSILCKYHVFQQFFSILSNFSVFTFWAIGKISQLKISCHSQNLSFWSNYLCRIKSVRWGFWVWFLGPSKPHTLVPIKMSVSSLTPLHTLCQTLSFSTISKKQPLCQSVIKLNPVFQPILTVYFILKCNSQYGLEHRVLSSNSQSLTHHKSQTVSARKLTFWENVHPHYVSHVMCHMWDVRSQVSCFFQTKWCS